MVYILILNWNGWLDTVGCIQSLCGLEGTDYRIIVCDNGSTDGSIGRIKSLAGDMAEEENLAHNLASSHPMTHPRLRRLTHYHPLSMNAFTLERLNEQIDKKSVEPANADVTLIMNEANLGFAAGNNSGIRYALAQEDMTHLWLLNNDTLVEPDSLQNMMKRLGQTEQSSICGLRVMFFDDPAIVQALGGNQFNRWIGTASESLGRFSSEKEPRDSAKIEQEIDYVSGCSMLLPKAFIEEVGLMDESYFLYYEEIDWMQRAKKMAKGKYPFVYADDAVIYHKEGSAIGSASLTTRPSPLSDFYCARNKLRFMAKYFPARLPLCYFFALLQVLNRCRRGYWASAWLLLKVLLGKKYFYEKPLA